MSPLGELAGIWGRKSPRPPGAHMQMFSPAHVLRPFPSLRTSVVDGEKPFPSSFTHADQGGVRRRRDSHLGYTGQGITHKGPVKYRNRNKCKNPVASSTSDGSCPSCDDSCQASRWQWDICLTETLLCVTGRRWLSPGVSVAGTVTAFQQGMRS